jgi:hypothetical protein
MELFFKLDSPVNSGEKFLVLRPTDLICVYNNEPVTGNNATKYDSIESIIENIGVTQGSINATCDCDDTVYSLYTGQSAGQQYPMKAYRVNLNGSTLVITN